MSAVVTRPRISCSTASLYHLPLGTALALIREAGFDGLEFVVSPESLLRGMPAMGRVVARSRLPALTFHPPLYPFPGWPRNQAEAMMNVVAGAERLGCEVGVIHAPRSRSLETPRAQRYISGLVAAREYAAAKGIAIGLETTQRPVAGKRPLLFDDLNFFLDFVDRLDLRVTLDTAHAGASGDDLLVDLARIGPRLRNIHYSDCRIDDPAKDPKTHLLPGTGNTIDLAAFTRALGGAGYAGVITLELAPQIVGLWPPRKILSQLAAAREFVALELDKVHPAQAARQPQ